MIEVPLSPGQAVMIPLDRLAAEIESILRYMRALFPDMPDPTNPFFREQAAEFIAQQLAQRAGNGRSGMSTLEIPLR